MIRSTRMLNTLWECTRHLRTTLLQCIFQKDCFDFIWRSISQFLACSDSSQVPHSMQEQKPCIKNISAKGGISDVRGWSGQLSEWQKQHKNLSRVLWLIIPWHYSVYYFGLFNWQTLTCGFQAFHAHRLRITLQSEWHWFGTSNAEKEQK